MTQTLAARDTLRSYTKRLAISCAGQVAPQARYDRMVVVLSHMRSATTALSNVLCTHPEIAGYGETHVPYEDARGPGQLILNLALRRAYARRARFVFDKVLHDRLDAAPPPAFYTARAILLVRAPGPAVASVLKLAERTGMPECRTPVEAAEYYAERLDTLARHWDSFPATRRIGLTASALLADPDAAVGSVGRCLNLTPPLENRYVSHAASTRGGGGDPTRSAKHTRIEPRPAEPEPPVADVPAALAARCEAAYRDLRTRFEQATQD